MDEPDETGGPKVATSVGTPIKLADDASRKMHDVFALMEEVIALLDQMPDAIEHEKRGGHELRFGPSLIDSSRGARERISEWSDEHQAALQVALDQIVALASA